jgi:hypothetical protein
VDLDPKPSLANLQQNPLTGVNHGLKPFRLNRRGIKGWEMRRAIMNKVFLANLFVAGIAEFVQKDGDTVVATTGLLLRFSGLSKRRTGSGGSGATRYLIGV